MVHRFIDAQAARLAWTIGAGLGSGLFPVAPATAGSLLALAIYWFSPLTGDSPGLFVLIGAGFLLGLWAMGRMSTEANPDPKQAVWDEFIGMWATCVLVPKTLPWMAAAFICFRVLDIWKPWPISYVDGKVKGGIGVMLDDVLAGFLTLMIVGLIKGLGVTI